MSKTSIVKGTNRKKSFLNKVRKNPLITKNNMASQDLVNTKSDISLVTCLSFTDSLQGQNTKPSVGQFSQPQICLIVCFLFFLAPNYI